MSVRQERVRRFFSVGAVALIASAAVLFALGTDYVISSRSLGRQGEAAHLDATFLWWHFGLSFAFVIAGSYLGVSASRSVRAANAERAASRGSVRAVVQSYDSSDLEFDDDAVLALVPEPDAAIPVDLTVGSSDSFGGVLFTFVIVGSPQAIDNRDKAHRFHIAADGRTYGEILSAVVERVERIEGPDWDSVDAQISEFAQSELQQWNNQRRRWWQT